MPRSANQAPAPDALAAGGRHALIRDLGAWFGRARRDLPWRRTRDAYAIWISESMLQQTRVEAVIPYFERFLVRFPTVAALSAAPLEDVLAAWSGLGYYRRARALHAAARAVVERHGGRFPTARADLEALPGVGPYTAGAVASIAFDAPEALVDGNVARVLARIFALDDPQESSAFRAATWRLARELVADLDGASAGDWNQALMELGAVVCLPRAPRCLACPVSAHCRAAAEGRAEALPVPRRRPEPIDVGLEIALVRDAGRLLLVRRPETGRMAGLWELPTREPSGERRLAENDWPRTGRGTVADGEEIGAVAHAITRHRIRARVLSARWIGGEPRAPLAFVPHASALALGLTGLARKVLRARFAR